jgi:hypothetical protein
MESCRLRRTPRWEYEGKGTERRISSSWRLQRGREDQGLSARNEHFTTENLVLNLLNVIGSRNGVAARHLFYVCLKFADIFPDSL